RRTRVYRRFTYGNVGRTEKKARSLGCLGPVSFLGCLGKNLYLLDFKPAGHVPFSRTKITASMATGDKSWMVSFSAEMHKGLNSLWWFIHFVFLSRRSYTIYGLKDQATSR